MKKFIILFECINDPCLFVLIEVLLPKLVIVQVLLVVTNSVEETIFIGLNQIVVVLGVQAATVRRRKNSFMQKETTRCQTGSSTLYCLFF